MIEHPELSAPSVFIPSEKLGILEPLIREYCTLQTKRARRIKLREVAMLLQKLHLVHKKTSIAALGLGCNLLGEHGLLVLLEYAPVKPAGPIGDEK